MLCSLGMDRWKIIPGIRAPVRYFIIDNFVTELLNLCPQFKTHDGLLDSEDKNFLGLILFLFVFPPAGRLFKETCKNSTEIALMKMILKVCLPTGQCHQTHRDNARFNNSRLSLSDPPNPSQRVCVEEFRNTGFDSSQGRLVHFVATFFDAT